MENNPLKTSVCAFYALFSEHTDHSVNPSLNQCLPGYGYYSIPDTGFQFANELLDKQAVNGGSFKQCICSSGTLGSVQTKTAIAF